MIKQILFIIILISCSNSFAKEVTLKYQLQTNKALATTPLTLNANFTQVDGWQQKPILLLTHGTLFHNASELMTGLQELFAENNISSLVINLSLGLDNRHGAYDCQVPHIHKHEDAVEEIGVWLNWLKKQGAKNIILVGHSRGGNQTAWFASEHDSPIISKIILIAPQIWSTEYARKGYNKRFGKNLDDVLSKAQVLVDNNKGHSFLSPVDFIYCKDTKATAEAFVSYYNTDLRKDSLFVLPKIKKPVLVFAGTEDTVVKDLDKKINQMSPQNNIRLEVIDGADHSFRDLYSEEIVEFSVEFINSTQ